MDTFSLQQSMVLSHSCIRRREKMYVTLIRIEKTPQNQVRPCRNKHVLKYSIAYPFFLSLILSNFSFTFLRGLRVGVKMHCITLKIYKELFQKSLWSFKGYGMGPWLVLVSPCFRETVVATCKIGSFLCNLDNLLQKNVIVLFFGNQISKWRPFEKRTIFALLFTFFSHQGKLQRFL